MIKHNATRSSLTKEVYGSIPVIIFAGGTGIQTLRGDTIRQSLVQLGSVGAAKGLQLLLGPQEAFHRSAFLFLLGSVGSGSKTFWHFLRQLLLGDEAADYRKTLTAEDVTNVVPINEYAQPNAQPNTRLINELASAHAALRQALDGLRNHTEVELVFGSDNPKHIVTRGPITGNKTLQCIAPGLVVDRQHKADMPFLKKIIMAELN